MAFSKITADMNNHQRLGNEPNVDNGITAEDLKILYDKAANDLKDGVNKIVDELQDKRIGYEASKTLTAGKMYETDPSDGNIDAKLVHLKQLIDGVALGAVPDGSISKAKLDFGDTIPTNEQMGVVYLASKYSKPINTGENIQEYETPSLSSSNRQGYVITSSEAVSDVYTFIGGDGQTEIYGASESGYSGTNEELIIELPFVMQITKISLTCSRKKTSGFVRCQGSVDGSNYTDLPGFSMPVTDGDMEKKTFNITTKSFYKYIRFYVGSSNDIFGGGGICNDIRIWGKTLSTMESANKLEITTDGNAKLEAYEEGQIVKIETPPVYVVSDNLSSTLNINTIGPKSLPNDLEPSTKYTLVYNGTAFEKEV